MIFVKDLIKSRYKEELTLKLRTYYTAVGRFVKHHDPDGGTYPVVYVGQREHLLDLQEMAVWSALNWRLADYQQLEHHYDALAKELHLLEPRTLENCLHRLEVRGLVASGTGESDLDALYDLLSELYVVSISESLLLRAATFVKLTLWDGVPLSTAKRLFQRRQMNAYEKQIMALSKQALLSTAELVKCMEVGISDFTSDDAIVDALYNDDDTTSENIRYLMLHAGSRTPVTLAVANLCLGKQILFERV